MSKIVNSLVNVGSTKKVNKAFFSLACFKTVFVVWRDFIALSTTKFLGAIELNFAGSYKLALGGWRITSSYLTKEQFAFMSSLFNFGVRDFAIQLSNLD